MWNAILDIHLARDLKPVPPVIPLQMRLGREIDRHVWPALVDLLQRLRHQLMAQPGAPRLRCNDHAADHHVTALLLGIEQTQVRHQPILVPGHQVAGIALQVLAIDVLIDAFLLHDEHFGAQLQNGVQLLFAQIAVVFADPVDCHVSIP